MTPIHSGHQTVKNMYETFPYPSEGWIYVDPHRRGMINYHASRCCRAPIKADCRILVAGCGTEEAVHWALTFPKAEVIGIDLSENSLDLARQCARKLGAKNLTLRQLDILDAAKLKGGPFDLISSYGVLHHMTDPTAGLAALKGVLAPGGLMQLMVYNTTNRYWLQAVQSLVTDMCHDSANVRERFEVARLLLRDLARHDGHQFQSLARSAMQTLEESEAAFMDAYAHPQEQSYTIESLHAWLASGGMRFTGWVNPWQWNPRRVVSDAGLIERLERMPGPRRDHFIDQTRHPLFEFYAEPVDVPVRARPCDEDDEAFWARIPLTLTMQCYEVAQGRPTGLTGFAKAQHEVIPGDGPDGASNPIARVWVDPAYDYKGHPIMLRILEEVDGKRTMRELAEAVCASVSVPFEGVRAALHGMFRSFLLDAQCIDIDPERCHGCRHRCGLE